MRHSSAPESKSAPTDSDTRPQAREAGNNLSSEGGWMSERLTRTPRTPLESRIFWPSRTDPNDVPRLPTVQAESVTHPLFVDLRGQPQPTQLHGLVFPLWPSQEGARWWERWQGSELLGGDVWPDRAGTGGPG